MRDVLTGFTCANDISSRPSVPTVSFSRARFVLLPSTAVGDGSGPLGFARGVPGERARQSGEPRLDLRDSADRVFLGSIMTLEVGDVITGTPREWGRWHQATGLRSALKGLGFSESRGPSESLMDPLVVPAGNGVSAGACCGQWALTPRGGGVSSGRRRGWRGTLLGIH